MSDAVHLQSEGNWRWRRETDKPSRYKQRQIIDAFSKAEAVSYRVGHLSGSDPEK
jgi:hypothetical protein